MSNLEKKFSKIYDNLVEKVYRFIFLKVDSKEAAEDLTSQVFLKVWNTLKKENNQFNTSKRKKKRVKKSFNASKPVFRIKNISAYIYQIARSEVADYYKEKQKFKIVSAENVQIVDAEADIARLEEKKSDVKELLECIHQLKEDYQNIIIWRYLDGLSYKKIADIMKKPEGTIRVMAHRALKELKAMLE